jgi:hypothetical protein
MALFAVSLTHFRPKEQLPYEKQVFDYDMLTDAVIQYYKIVATEAAYRAGTLGLTVITVMNNRAMVPTHTLTIERK